jgi:hypothetical protein
LQKQTTILKSEVELMKLELSTLKSQFAKLQGKFYAQSALKDKSDPEVTQSEPLAEKAEDLNNPFAPVW